MSWTVHILNATVEREIRDLPKDLKADLFHVLELIETVGLEELGPLRSKPLRGKLWELRLKGRDGIGRAIYVTASGRRVVVVHAFVKKTQKAPKAALAVAERRAKEIKE